MKFLVSQKTLRAVAVKEISEKKPKTIVQMQNDWQCYNYCPNLKNCNQMPGFEVVTLT